MPTFYDSFLKCADQWPQNVALEIQGRDEVEGYRYDELRQMSQSIARWITENKFEAGSRLAILADNHPRWVAAYLGINAAGCTAVPLDTAFHADQVAKLLRDSEASLLFTDTRHLPIVRDAVKSLQVGIVLTDPGSPAQQSASGWASDLDSIFAAGPGDFTPVPFSADDIAALLYTSGTTADPKGVMLTHANLMAEASGVFGVLKLGPEDAVLGVLPLFHSLAQMANLLLPLSAGARVVYLETLNTTELLRALRERKITAFAVVPQFFYLIHERISKEVAERGNFAKRGLRLLMGLNRLLRKFGGNAGPLFFGRIHETFGREMRYLVTGGSRFDPKIARDFHALGIDILQAYGLTETTGGAFVNRPSDIVIGSVGKPLPGVEAKIIEAKNDRSNSVDSQGDDERNGGGEVVIRGPIVMKGYWNRPDATGAVMQDGWLLTGDLGYFDSHGNLFITGRRKELIVLSNGKNIYPEEIEAQYLKSPYIKEICVMALESKPGDATSERLYAVIVPNFNALRERKIVNTKEVIRFDIEGLSQKLPSTKRIASYEIWQDDLPRTTTRKLKRFEIEKRVRAGRDDKQESGSAFSEPETLSNEDQVWMEQPDVQRALKVIRERTRTKPDSIRPTDNLELDLGLDSMQRVELLVAVEEQLGGDVEESRLSEIYTVREVVNAVRESAARGKNTSSARRPSAAWNTILAEESADPEVLTLTKSRPVSSALLYLFSRVLQVFALDRFHLRVRGLEKLPKAGPFILSSNHQSYIDPLVLASTLPGFLFRNLFAVGTSDIFGSGLMRRLAPWVRTVVVDPDANLIPAMRAGAFGLRNGRILILYPEGERSIDGQPKVFKKGAAILSIHLQVPIVPVAIEGFHDAWPRGMKFQKFAPLKIVFGAPIYPPQEYEASEAAYEKLTVQLKQRVVEMWEELRASNEKARAATAD